MGRYICLCGDTFKKKSEADKHLKMYGHFGDIFKDLGLTEFPRHKIFNQHWHGRLSTWLLGFPWKRIFRSIGCYLICFILFEHFRINFEWWEVVLLGTGIGLHLQ